MTILVTGGTGFIGARVVHRLAERHIATRCLVRRGSRIDRIVDLPVATVTGDIMDPPSLDGAVNGCEACIHLAGTSGWGEMRDSTLHRVIVDGTRSLLHAARANGVRRFIYVSSAAAIGATDTPRAMDEKAVFNLAESGLAYAIAKREAEIQALGASAPDFDVVVVNPAETYGPNDDDWITAGSIRDVLRSWPAFAVAGGTSIVHVDDVADGIVAALERGRSGERYILGGDNLTLREIIAMVLELAGSRRPLITIPFPILSAMTRACRAAGVPPPVVPEMLGYLRRYWFMDSTKAERELGHTPRPAHATLEPVVRWIKGLSAATGVPPALRGKTA